jgi:hypothetical protein
MAKNTIATDSAEELKSRIGDDATATFEDDPTFVESNPTGNASSENVEVQRDTDDVEDSEEEEEDAEAEDEEDEEDVIGEDDEDDEDEDEDEEDIEDEEDDEDLEDDENEVATATAMRADGLLGQEDEQEDVARHRDRAQGDAARNEDADQDDGDVEQGVDEDALDEDDLDTDQIAARNLRTLAALPLTGHAACGAMRGI